MYAFELEASNCHLKKEIKCTIFIIISFAEYYLISFVWNSFRFKGFWNLRLAGLVIKFEHLSLLGFRPVVLKLCAAKFL